MVMNKKGKIFSIVFLLILVIIIWVMFVKALDFEPIDSFSLDEDFGTFFLDLSANVSDLEDADSLLNFTWTNSDPSVVTVETFNGTDNVYTTECYQETANDSLVTATNPSRDNGDCDLDFSGSYACTGTFWSTGLCPEGYDGDWSNLAFSSTSGGMIATIFVNYTKPPGAASTSLWVVEDQAGLFNLTIDGGCWNQNPLQFKMSSFYSENDMIFYCYDNVDWIVLRTNPTQRGVREEAMIWNISYPSIKFTSVANATGSADINITVWNTDGNQNSTNFTLTINAINDAPLKVGNLDNATFDSDTTSPINNLIPKSDFDNNWTDVEDASPTTYELVASTNSSTSCYFDGSNNWDCEIVSNATKTDLYTISVNDTEGLSVIYDWQITINDASAPYVVSTVLRGWENDTQQFNFYNETSAYDIEKFNITVEINDDSTIETLEIFWRTTNGTNIIGIDRCQDGEGSSRGTIGNKEDDELGDGLANCHKWISAIEMTDTDTMFAGVTVGDGIEFTNITVNDTSRTIQIMIDELYKNTIKDYPFFGNETFFDNGTDFRITKNNYRKFSMDTMPNDASFYQFDLRMQVVNNPRFPLEVHICNPDYSTGDPDDSSNCATLDTLVESDSKPEDTTKYRTTFGNDTIDLVGGNITNGWIVLSTEENNPNRYYALTYFNKREGDVHNHSYYSTDSGTTWNQITTKSDAISIHWFYSGTTCFEYFFQTTDNESNVANSSISSQCWTQFDVDDKPSGPILTAPLEFYNWTGTQTITWEISVDPEGDDFFYEIELQNEDGTFNYTIANESTGITKSTSSYSWDTSLVSDGIYNMTIKAVQNESTIGLNSTKFVMAQGFTIDNTIPNLNLITPENNSGKSTSDVEFRYSVTDDNTITFCNLTLNDIEVENDSSISQGINSFTTRSLADATYNYSVACEDVAGNLNQSSTYKFTVSAYSQVGGAGSGGTAGVSYTVSGLNNSYLCKKIKIFLEENPSVYTPYDIDDLRQEIGSEINIIPSKSLINQYINNYDSICFNVSIEEEIIEEEEKENIVIEIITEPCNVDVDGHINFVLFELPIYKTFRLPEIGIGDISCKSINFWKHILRLERDGDITITGIRIYVVLLLMILGYVIYIIKKTTDFSFLGDLIRKRNQ